MVKYSREQVMEVISSVMGKVQDNQAQPLDHIYAELSGLATTIENMHQEILATRPHDVSGHHIPSATDELDAVVGATETASASIMDAAEAIQNLVENADAEIQAPVMDQTMKIFEACSFQDITGQRITKVIKTLRDIEVAVDNLLTLFGEKEAAHLKPVEDTRSEDEKLMNGPQMDGQGVSQDDIDKLLAEFD